MDDLDFLAALARTENPCGATLSSSSALIYWSVVANTPMKIQSTCSKGSVSEIDVVHHYYHHHHHDHPDCLHPFELSYLPFPFLGTYRDPWIANPLLLTRKTTPTNHVISAFGPCQSMPNPTTPGYSYACTRSYAYRNRLQYLHYSSDHDNNKHPPRKETLPARMGHSLPRAHFRFHLPNP